MKLNKVIEEALEKQFPKGHIARSEALVLHAIAQIELEKAVKAERKRYLKNLNDSQKEVYNAFIQCFEDETYNIDKFLIWLVRNRDVKQSIYLYNKH